MRSAAGLDGTRNVDGGADHAKADQVRRAWGIANMFDDLRAMADHHADRARLRGGHGGGEY